MANVSFNKNTQDFIGKLIKGRYKGVCGEVGITSAPVDTDAANSMIRTLNRFAYNASSEGMARQAQSFAAMLQRVVAGAAS